jgi:dihydrodipicolinate synthase/N-acetylneuraminate lyase
LIGELGRLGVPQSEARRSLHQRGVAATAAALDYTRRRMADKKLAALENPAAYFRHALDQAYAGAAASAKASAPPAPARPAVDIHQAFEAQRQQEAQAYFAELAPAEQAALVDEYNAGQATEALKIKKRSTKLSQAGFLRWLALRTWGTPTPEELLNFAQKLLSERPKR